MTTTSVTVIQPASDGHQVCLACGLCCRGVWFSRVVLEEDEVEPARIAGLPLEMIGEKTGFQQPCVLHQDGCCSAYQVWRPKVCVNFSCKLLDRLVAGEIPLTDALAHVKAARTMADSVTSEAGCSPGGLQGDEFLEKLIHSTETDADGRPSLSPAARLDAVALRIYYQKYFQKTAD